MPSTVQELLKYKGMTALYSESRYNVQTPLTDQFFVSPVNADTDDYDIFVNPTDTTPSPLNRRDASARVRSQVGMTQRRGVLFRTFDMQSFGSSVMQALQEPDSRQLDKQGSREILRQIQAAKAAQALTKELAIAKILTDGVVYWNRSTGQIVEAAGSDVESIDFGVAAANKGTLGGLVTQNLTNAAFDFYGLFDAIDETATQNNAPIPTDVWVDAKHRHNIFANTQFGLWAAKNGMDSQDVLRGKMIDGFAGKNWHFCGGMYTNSAGTKVKYVPLSKMVLTPALSDRTWCEAANGETLVPTSTGTSKSIEEALRSIETVYGPFAYSKVNDNPVRVESYSGDCFGFNFTNPDAVFQATVTGY